MTNKEPFNLESELKKAEGFFSRPFLDYPVSVPSHFNGDVVIYDNNSGELNFIYTNTKEGENNENELPAKV